MAAAHGRPPRTRLRVSIQSARGLRAADLGLLGGKSDPYCACQLRGRPHSRLQTATVSKSLEPVWNFQGLIDGCAEGDALDFEVFDHDVIGQDDLLGRVSLAYEDFHPDGFEGELPLSDAGKGKSASVYIRVDVEEMPPPTPGAPRAFVRVVGADGLRAADWGGTSDPYCVCRIPAKPNSKFHTKVLSRELNPVWDEEDEVLNYEPGDSLEFLVYDWDMLSAHDLLGSYTLKSGEFHPHGFDGTLPLGTGTLTVAVDIYMPPLMRRAAVDPGQHIGPQDRHPAPFLLRSLETGKMHRLAAFTRIGRSRRELDQSLDLVLTNPGNGDVSRFHAVVKAWPGPDPSSWFARVYDFSGRGQPSEGPGGGHTAGGTFVDGAVVDAEIGTAIEPGGVARFGVNELWVLEKATMQQRSQVAEIACTRAKQNTVEDPAAVRELCVPHFACHAALQHCVDWLSLVRVTLECRDEPNEPPCVDYIEVQDECGVTASKHWAQTLEEQEAYDVKRILRDVRLGTTIRLRLSSDPCLLGPILEHLDGHRKWLANMYERRASALQGIPG